MLYSLQGCGGDPDAAVPVIPWTMPNYGFAIDLRKSIGCHACTIAWRMGVHSVYALAIATSITAAVLIATGMGDRSGPSDMGLGVAVGIIVGAVALPVAVAVVLLHRARRELEVTRRQAGEQIERLDAQHVLLKEIAAATDVTLTLQGLARRIRDIVPCDRIGLVLPKPSGGGFQTFTGRVDEQERRLKARVEVEFGPRGTLIAEIIDTGEARLFPDLTPLAPDYLDANFFTSSGFRSAAMLPLTANDRTFGVLFAIARHPDRFDASHLRALRPVAEILGLLHVAQQLRIALTRLHTTEAMAEVTLSIAADINSALQIIIGHCDLLERAYPDPKLQRDVATLVRQAQRIADLLDKMRVAAKRRLQEVSAVVGKTSEPGA